MKTNIVYNYDYYDFWSSVKEASAQVVLVDPPYGHNKEDWDKTVGFLGGGGWFEPAFKALAETGTLFITIDTQNVWNIMQQTPNPTDFIIWDKRGSLSWSAMRARKNSSIRRTEVILGYAKNLDTRIWHPGWKADVIKQLSNGTGAIKWHSTPKPLGLYKKLIAATCDPGSDHLVCDPAAGTGTAGVAAKFYNLPYILNDSSEDYVKMINWRLAQHPDPYFPEESFKTKHKSLF